MQYSMKLLESPFYRIKDGTKTVEFRLYDDKRKQIKVGDTIEFSLLPDLEEKLLVEVVDLFRGDSFRDLFEMFYSDEGEIKNKVEGIYRIYSREDEMEFGVLGIKIKLL